MNLWLRRFSSQEDSTLGLLFVQGEFFCFTLEDEERNVKVAGETRIPKGTYFVKKRMVESPLTIKYRKRFPSFFDFHLELQDIPGFQHVYIHIGNDDDHTDGCILVGDQVKSNIVDEENNLLSSTAAFKRLYNLISDALEDGQKVMIKVTDHEYL